jgi:hypothetical protein
MKPTQPYFFSHLIDIKAMHIKLQMLDLSEEERAELLKLAHDTIQYAIVQTILSELSHEDKKIFLRQLHLADHAGMWRFLNRKVKNIEEKVKQVAEEFLKEFHKDIEEAKKKHQE